MLSSAPVLTGVTAEAGKTGPSISSFPLPQTFPCEQQQTYLDVRQSTIHALQSSISLSEGRSWHDVAIKHGLDEDNFICNLLISMYKHNDSVPDARRVFDNMWKPNVVSWNSIISAYTQHGCHNEALRLFERMQINGIEARDVTFLTVLPACSSPAALGYGRSIHMSIITCEFDANVSIINALITMYSNCGSLDEAIDVFRDMKERTVVSWTSMITTFVQHGKFEKAFQLFEEMEIHKVDRNNVTFVTVLRACVDPSFLEYGFHIHACIIGSGYGYDVNVSNALMYMYGRCESVLEAELVFLDIKLPDVSSWNAIFTVYNQLGYNAKAIELFEDMLRSDVCADQITLVNLVGASASIEALQEGKLLHMYILENNHEHNAILATALINMYGKCKSLHDARAVFDRINMPDLVAWTCIISLYANFGQLKEALGLLKQMEMNVGKGNEITFITLLGACADNSNLEDGRMVHNFIVDGGLEVDDGILIALVDMYGKCSAVLDAEVVFHKISCHCVVSWTALISAYVQNGYFKEALSAYKQMQSEDVDADKVVFLSILGACAGLSNLQEGRRVHLSIVDSGFEHDISIGNALIDMYSKSGVLDEAHIAFKKIHNSNIVSWATIISAYAHHGHGKEAVKLFRSMQSEKVAANNFTFVSLLSACNHAGLIDEANLFFSSMVDDYGLSPTLEHYNCIIDLLGRAGRMEEAEVLINKLPIKADAPVWTSLINACKSYGDIKRGEKAVSNTSLRTSSYVLLSNLYAASG